MKQVEKRMMKAIKEGKDAKLAKGNTLVKSFNQNGARLTEIFIHNQKAVKIDWQKSYMTFYVCEDWNKYNRLDYVLKSRMDAVCEGFGITKGQEYGFPAYHGFDNTRSL